MVYISGILLSSCCLFAKLCPTLLATHGLYPGGLLWPWDFPGKKTGVGCHFLLQGIFLNQGLNPPFYALQGGFFTTEVSGKPIILSTRGLLLVIR